MRGAMRKPDNNQQPSLSPPQLLSIEEAMEILHVGPTKMNELIAKDGFPVFTLGGRGRERRVDLSDFNDWLQKQKKAVGA